MKSEAFVTQLRDAMTKMNLDEDIKEKHINNFLMLFAGKSEEEIDGIIESSGGLESILSGINDLENKKHKYLLDDLEKEAREIKKLNGTEAESDDFENDAPVSETKEINIAKNIGQAKKPVETQSEQMNKTVTRPVVKPAEPADDEEEKPRRRTSRTAIKLAEKCAKLRRNMSDAAFCISVPFICVGIALLFSLIILLYPVLWVLRLAVTIINFAVMIVGTLLSGTGIVYGGIKFGSSPFTGLYEIGLGIVLGGLTLLISVLLCNYLKRLSPFLKECIKDLYSSFIMCVKAFFTLRVKEERK